MDTKKIGEIQESISSVGKKIKEVQSEDFSHIFEEELSKISSESSKGKTAELQKDGSRAEQNEITNEVAKLSNNSAERREHMTGEVNLGDDIMLFVEGLEARRIIYESDEVNRRNNEVNGGNDEVNREQKTQGGGGKSERESENT